MKILILDPPSMHSRNVVRDLLYGCWCKGKRVAGVEFPNMDLLRFYTILKETKNNIRFIDSAKENLNPNSLMATVKDFMPELVIITTSTMSFKEDCDILKKIKTITGCKTVALGSHVTFFPKFALKNEGVDFIIKHEAEFTIKRLIDKLSKRKDYRNLKGIGFKAANKIFVNKDEEFEQNLDKFPIPDRQPILGFAYFNPLVKKIPWTTMITSRGCLNKCNFCTSRQFYGSRYRFNSPERVVKEIKYLVRLGYKEIFFRDENFTADNKRVKDICKAIIKEDIKVSWICSSRVDTVNEGLIMLMRKAGCHMIRFGVESGNQNVLDNIKKGITLEQTKETFRLCHKHKMDTHAHLMVGCVGENWRTIDDTIKFVKMLNPTTLTCGAYTPIPGTDIFAKIKKENPDIKDGSDCNLKFLHEKGYLSKFICELNDREVGKAVKKVYMKLYLRPSYILNTFLRIKSIDEFRRVLLSAINVLSFIFNE